MDMIMDKHFDGSLIDYSHDANEAAGRFINSFALLQLTGNTDASISLSGLVRSRRRLVVNWPRGLAA
jgi:hypothetical protein